MKEEHDGLGVYSRHMNLKALKSFKHDIVFSRLVGHLVYTLITVYYNIKLTQNMALRLTNLTLNFARIPVR